MSIKVTPLPISQFLLLNILQQTYSTFIGKIHQFENLTENRNSNQVKPQIPVLPVLWRLRQWEEGLPYVASSRWSTTVIA